jgi:3-isopropylmalate/(R)-2-methylmalate dehydratase small subunit
MYTEITSGCYCVGDDVKALDIMPTRFKSSEGLSDDALATAAFADLDPSFATAARSGKYGVIVAGTNFGGGGKTVEGPVFALRGAGVKLVVAESFAGYFLRNSINNGFPVLVCPGVSRDICTGDDIYVNLDSGDVHNLTRGTILRAQPLSQIALNILKSGGLVNYARAKLLKTQGVLEA